MNVEKRTELSGCLKTLGIQLAPPIYCVYSEGAQDSQEEDEEDESVLNAAGLRDLLVSVAYDLNNLA